MSIRIRPLLVSACALLAAQSVAAYEVDTSKYFAFYEFPGGYSGGVTIYPSYLFLSHDKCAAKGVEPDLKAYKGIRYNPLSLTTRNECWVLHKSGKLAICPVGKTETEEIGNACYDIDKNMFKDTSSLPKSAQL